MLFLLRMLLMSLHFMLAGVLGVLIGLCRPFNPDNSRLCARLYALPAMWILRHEGEAPSTGTTVATRPIRLLSVPHHSDEALRARAP